jgi:transcriptional regulator with XRE-family HTH domain
MNHIEPFHNWLIDELKQAQLTQSELATILGINRSVVSNWVTGRYVPTSTRIMLLVELFGQGEDNTEKLVSCMQSIITSIQQGKRGANAKNS